MSDIDAFLKGDKEPGSEIDSFLGTKAPEETGAIRRVVGDTAVSVAKGVVGVPEFGVGLADIVTGGRAGKAVEDLGVRFKDAKHALDSLYSPEQLAANKAVQGADGFVPTIVEAFRNPSVIAQTVAESVPSVFAGGALGRVAKAGLPAIGPIAAGATGEGLVSAGQTAEQVRQETPDGLLTPAQSMIAGGSGALTAGLGAAGGAVAKKLGITDVDTLIAGGAAGATKKALPRRVVEGMVSEGVLEELPQSAQEQIAQNLALGKPWDEGVGQAAALGMLAGGLMGGGAAVISNPDQKATEAPAKPLFPFITPNAAMRQAEAMAKKTGEEYEVGPHPTVPERFAIYPASAPPLQGSPDAPLETPAAGTAGADLPATGAAVDGGVPVQGLQGEEVAGAAQAPDQIATGVESEVTNVTPPILPEVAPAPVDSPLPPGQVERRANREERKRVADMTLDEARQELLVSPKAGIGSKRAYDEAPRREYQAALDMDGLKEVNDSLGHSVGDQLIAKMGEALREANIEGYHVSGDEFMAQFDDPESAKSALEGVRTRLQNATLEVTLPSGEKVTRKGIGFSYGIDRNADAADARLRAEKDARAAAGLRTPRGGVAGGVGQAPAARQQDNRGDAPAQVVVPAPIAAPQGWAPAAEAAGAVSDQDTEIVFSVTKGERRGEPRVFKSAESAEKFRAAQGMPKAWKAKPHGDRFVLARPPIDEAKSKRAAKAARERLKVKPQDDVLAVIGKMGGADIDALASDGADPVSMKAARFAGGIAARPFKKGGLKLDAIAEGLASMGFDVHDEAGRVDASKALELIHQALAGDEKVYSPEGNDYWAAKGEEAKAKALASELKAEDLTEAQYFRLSETDQEAVAGVLASLSEMDTAEFEGAIETEDSDLTDPDLERIVNDYLEGKHEALPAAGPSGQDRSPAAAPAKSGEETGARESSSREGRSQEEVARSEAPKNSLADAGVSASTSEKGGAKRFEIGASLTPAQRKATLATLQDAYRVHGLKKEIVGLDRNGNERWAYPYSPELFEKSDITGAMVRYYVSLPDGKLAHPSELFPEVDGAYIKRKIDQQIFEEQERKRRAKDEDKQATALAKDSAEAARAYWQERSDKSARTAFSNKPTILPPSERVMLEKKGRYYMAPSPKVSPGWQYDIDNLKSEGWREADESAPAQIKSKAANNDPDWLSSLMGDQPAPALELKGETEAEIRARESLEKKAADEKAKRDAAPSPDGFVLSGSSRAVDKARAAGQQELVPAAKPAESNTEDSGAELAYNKRNRIRTGIKWDDIAGKNETLRVAETTKQNVHPKPDYQALIDGGMEPMAAHIVKQVYDAVAIKPQTRSAPSDDDLKAYIAGVNRVMQGVTAWANDRKALAKWAAKQARTAGAMLGKPTDLSSLANDANTLLEIVYPEGWKAHRSEVILVGGNKVLRALQPGYEEVRRASKALDEGWPAKLEAWQRQGFKVEEKDGKWLVLDKRGRTKAEAVTEEAAKDQARELTKREAKDQISDKGISVEAAERVGEPRRMEGEDVTSDKLRDTFGFKGVNFGTWMKGDANRAERQLHLNHAYDSFMDLADILGVPPKAISLDGMLGVAIGAQGNGNYAAHFVPGLNEINLTRTSGAGSLAHEWGHALDHYFATLGKLNTRTDPFLTEHASSDMMEGKTIVENGRQRYVRSPIEGSTLRPEILAKFKAIVEAMNKRPETPEEVGARLVARRSKAQRNVESWLRAIRRDFVAAKVDEAAFDALAAKIVALDLGDGAIAVGNTNLSPRVDELRSLYKAAVGRVYALDNIKGLQANLDHFIYSQSDAAAHRSHEPQQVSTTYSANAAKLDKDKGGKRYWSTNLEMFARAFDAFVSDTLAERAAKNTYLSHAGRSGDTVPEGSERTAINTAIASLIDEIQTKETERGVAMFSKATSKVPFAVSNIRGILAKHFGEKAVADLIQAGRLRIVSAMSDVPESLQKSMEGAGVVDAIYAQRSGTAYLIADNLAPGKAVSVLYHELGEHHGLEAMLGEKSYARLQDSVRKFNAQKNPLTAKAWAHVVENYPELTEGSDKFIHEVIAKVGESAEAVNLSWFQQMLAGIKRFLRSIGITVNATDADLLVLVRASLKRVIDQSSMVPHGQLVSQPFGAAMAHKAYHGTPHDFDRFSTEKIGTGEGAQAYGYGLYFAGKREVAEHYRTNVRSHVMPQVTYKGKVLDPANGFSNDEREAFDLAYDIIGGKPYAVARLRRIDTVQRNLDQHRNLLDRMERGIANRNWGKLGEPSDENKQEMRDLIADNEAALKFLRDLADGDIQVEQRRGRLYEVELAPKEDEYLDWDKSYDGQGAAVRDALDRAEDNPPEGVDAFAWRLGFVDARWLGPKMMAHNFGSSLYRHFTETFAELNDANGSNPFYAERPDISASRYLASIGIPGIKYLDGSSRNARFNGDPAYLAAAKDFKRAGKTAHEALDGMRAAYRNATVADLSAAINEVYDENLNQHHNYVIFDDKHVEVKAKFSKVTLAERIATHPQESMPAGMWRGYLNGLQGANVQPALDWLADKDGKVSKWELVKALTPEGPMFSKATYGDDRISALRGSGRQLSDAVSDMLYTDKSFNPWHKSVGTQYHKANAKNRDGSLANPEFKAVYDRGQDYLHEFSRAALQAADMAPHLLPKIEGFRGVVKSIAGSAKPKDIAAIAQPLMDGTLQDEDGNPHKGRVWTNDELRSKYNLTDNQIALYREARAAIDASLDELLASEVAQLVRKDLGAEILAQMKADPANAGNIAGDALALMADKFDSQIGDLIDPKKPGNLGEEAIALSAEQRRLRDLATTVVEKQQTVTSLKDHGYAPLMRFGQYSVSVYAKNADGSKGELQYFSLHEKQSEVAAVKRELALEFPEGLIESGVKSELSYQMYRGLTPDTLELFAHTLGIGDDATFQQYLKVAKNTRSAFKRMIHRKGLSGFDVDPTRHLAAFITSNARATAGNWHMGEMVSAVEDIPQGKGDVKDEAVKLVSYLQNPKEEAPALRNYLFIQYLGGSFASALVNMTQPLTMSFPYLAQFGAAKAASRLTTAMAQAMRSDGNLDPALQAALAKGEKEGVVAPHEIHMLHAEAMRTVGANIWLRRGLTAWGSLFSAAESFNRRTTFIAAWRIANEQGTADPYAFAAKAVEETQGVYNKGNRPNWGRGPIGSTLMTFKQFSIQYIEFLKRLPARERTLALGVLFVLAGAQGIPFAGDAEDLIDTIAQSLGYSFNSRQEMRHALTRAFGKTGADFVMHGGSHLPGVPIDVQGRLGMGNLIPGTSAFKQSLTPDQRIKEALQVLGPVGGLVGSVSEGAQGAVSGDVKAASKVLPIVGSSAIQNVIQAVDMWQLGMYRDRAGKKIKDTTDLEAIVKGVGFQPKSVAAESLRVSEQLQNASLHRQVEDKIADKWAQGVFENLIATRPEQREAAAKKVAEAREDVIEWNRKNPEAPIRIQPQQIFGRVKEMRSSREQRIVKRAPREIRAGVRSELSE